MSLETLQQSLKNKMAHKVFEIQREVEALTKAFKNNQVPRGKRLQSLVDRYRELSIEYEVVQRIQRTHDG